MTIKIKSLDQMTYTIGPIGKSHFFFKPCFEVLIFFYLLARFLSTLRQPYDDAPIFQSLLANMHLKCISQVTKNWGQNDCHKKREDATEAVGLGDTPLNPISILPTKKCLCALQWLVLLFVEI